MKTTSTKRALVLSVLALVICVSMLVGTTFAWFTDEVTSGMNRIQAGNLDVELLMDKAETGTYAPISGDDGDIFSEATGNGVLWEPGKTEIVYLAVENKGSLALKYNFLLNITDGNPGLVGSLEYAVLDGVKKADMTATTWAEIKAAAYTGNVVEGVTLAAPNGSLLAGDIEYFALAVHMKEEAGNEFQNGEIIIDVILNATQLTYEEDSFGTDYDKLATFKNGAFLVREFNKTVPVSASTFEIANDDATVKVAGTVATGATEVAVSVTPTSTNDDLTTILAGNTTVNSYDIEVVGYEPGSVVTVDIFAGIGLTNVKVFHEGVEMAAADYTYDPITGFVTISATDFSVYSISHNTLGQHPLARVEYLDEMPTVNADGRDFVLDAGYQFTAVEDVDAAIKSDYRYWHADFVVSVDKDVAEGSLGIAGQYDAFSTDWLAFLAPEGGVKANQPIRLLADAGEVIVGSPIYINYEELCSFVKVFKCGAFDVDGANAGTTINVELRLYETEDPSENLNSTNIETGNYVVIGSYNYTF